MENLGGRPPTKTKKTYVGSLELRAFNPAVDPPGPLLMQILGAKPTFDLHKNCWTLLFLSVQQDVCDKKKQSRGFSLIL